MQKSKKDDMMIWAGSKSSFSSLMHQHEPSSPIGQSVFPDIRRLVATPQNRKRCTPNVLCDVALSL